MKQRLIDLSHPLATDTPPWPGNPAVRVEILDAIPPSRQPGERGIPGRAGYLNVSEFSTCTHTGTHMDAPAHFYNGVRTIERVPLGQCIGPAVLVDLRHKSPRDEITPGDLAPHEGAILRARKVVLNTGWAARWGLDDYFLNYPVLGEAAADWLVERGVELVGVDTPSVDREPNPAHFILLGGQLVIVENLANLDAIGRPEFELVVLPLPLRGLEASPVRAVAILPE